MGTNRKKLSTASPPTTYVIDREALVSIAQQIGEAIRVRRLNWPGGMSVRDLARRVSVSRSTISAYESGKRLPSVEALFALAIELGIDLNALVRGKAQPSRAVPQVDASSPDQSA